MTHPTYGILTEDGTCRENETDTLEDALRLFHESRRRERSILVLVLADSEHTTEETYS